MKNTIPVLLLLGLAACATNPVKNYARDPGATLLMSQALPAPSAADANGVRLEYRIAPSDVVTVDVAGIEELTNRELTVDSAGMVAVPIAGALTVAGLTPLEMQEAIAAKLRAAYVRDPNVAVNVKEAKSQFVAVDGAVKEPGLYPVVGNMTLIRAVASAKGLADEASRREVVVLRTVAGQKYVALYDLGAIRRGNYADPQIYPNDVVVVGESATRRFFQFAAAGAASLSPLILLLQATK